MAVVVRRHHRAALWGLLDQVHRLRRRVVMDGVVEADEFDQGACLNLVAVDTLGRVRAATRLTPSLDPNLSCDVLQARLGGGFPRAPHIVEVSCHCVDPDLDDAARREILLDIRASQLELGRKHGWTHKLEVSYDHDIQPWIRAGMQVDILGRPFLFPGDSDLSFGWMLTLDIAKPNAGLDFLGAETGFLQDPDEDPGLLQRYGEQFLQEA